MAKKRTEITEQMGSDIIRRRDQGESMAAIGRIHNVDYRTVQNWLKKVTKGGSRDHWEAVSRQVDAKYLDEHFRQLLCMSMALLDIVHSEPVYHHQDAQALLNDRTEGVMRPVLNERELRLGITPSRSRLHHHPSSNGQDGKYLVRWVQRLVSALWDHEPKLETTVNEWKKQWDSFQQARLKLLKEAKGLFKQKAVSDTAEEELKPEVVREVLETKLLGAESKLSRVVVKADTRRADLLRENPETRVYRVKIREANNKEDEAKAIHEANNKIEAIREAYEWVLQQLSLPDRVKPAKDAHRSLKGCIPQVEQLVDELVLRGRPRGQCGLCSPV